MALLTLAVISDIHIGDKARSSDLLPPGMTSELRNEGFLAKFEEFATTLPVQPDCLVIAGDLSCKADAGEIEHASAVITRVARALRIRNDEIFFVPGNHDVDWAVLRHEGPTESTRTLRWSQRYDPIQRTANVFHDRASCSSDTGFEGSLFDAPYAGIWLTPAHHLFVAINTSALDCPLEENHHGYIRKETIDWLMRKIPRRSNADQTVRCAILHHHLTPHGNLGEEARDFSVCQNADLLLEVLRDLEFDLIVHGHKHLPRFELQLIKSDFPIAQLGAGSFSADLGKEYGGGVHNQFHLLTIEGRYADTGRAYGMLRSWAYVFPKGWTPNIRNFAVIEHSIGFGGALDWRDLAKKLESPIAQRARKGTFVPMRADWIGTLKNKFWLSAEANEALFQWRLNLSTCVAFIDTAESCLKEYCSSVERPFAERDLSRMLAKSWFGKTDKSVGTLANLRTALEDAEWAKQLTSLARPCADDEQATSFDLQLFSPLHRGIQVLKRVVKFPQGTIWALALDELEFLEPRHHELINTCLRGKSDLAFKLSTMPYFHHTLQTTTSQPIVAGNDFDYVYLDNDPGIRRSDPANWETWAQSVLSRRIAFVEGRDHSDFTVERLLGNESPLLDEKPSSWSQDSQMMGLLRKYSNSKTIERAHRLPEPKFKDEISRKMHGMLLLRDWAGTHRGRSHHDLYSGPKFFARCSDANPRQLIRLFNELSLTRSIGTELSITESRIRPSHQAEVAVRFSGEALRNAATEEGVGGELYAFVKNLMEFFHDHFYRRPLTTDYYYAISLSDNVSDNDWKLVRYAVGLGLMFPKLTFSQPDQLPERDSGTFNLAFRLAPKFGLLPRQGRSVPLGTAKVVRKAACSEQYSLL